MHHSQLGRAMKDDNDDVVHVNLILVPHLNILALAADVCQMLIIVNINVALLQTHESHSIDFDLESIPCKNLEQIQSSGADFCVKILRKCGLFPLSISLQIKDSIPDFPTAQTCLLSSFDGASCHTQLQIQINGKLASNCENGIPVLFPLKSEMEHILFRCDCNSK